MIDPENTDNADDSLPELTFPTPEGTSSISPNSIEGIFLQALQKDDPADREAWLVDVCGGDQEQRLRVHALLRAYDDAGSFMETPASSAAANSEISLSFLKPIDKDGCLGTIGPYEVLEVIGRGGMGLVLRAVDLKLNRIVAVKVLLPELAANPNSRRRFLREAQAAAAISHPHVVTIHAVDDTHEDANGKPVPPYLVMECVVGQSLQQKLDRVGTLRLAEILRIGRQIGEGMAAAHKQGVIHRDIKPANILLENGVERVKITDFGLARAIDDITVTRTGEVSGTPQYMSPEQACGERVDHRSDLFSLDCVMYAMCTGHSPFRGDSIAHVIKRVTQDTPRPIAGQNSEIPPWLIEIITCLLQKNPDQRFQSAEGVVAILDQHLSRIQHPTESGSHSVINQQVPMSGGRLSAASLPEATVPATYGTADSVAGWRTRFSNMLLWIGVPLLCCGIIGLIGLAQGKTWHVTAFPSARLQELTLRTLGIAVMFLLPALFLRTSQYKSSPTGGSLLAWVLVGGPIGIVAWLLQRESHSRHVQALEENDSAGVQTAPAVQSTAAAPPLVSAGLLGPSSKVLVPNWMQSLSRIWLLLAISFFVISLGAQTTNVRIGPIELMFIFTLGALGSIVMAILLSRKAVTREVMAIALFLGLGPLGLLLYLLIKDGLQPAVADDIETPQTTRNDGPSPSQNGGAATIDQPVFNAADRAASKHNLQAAETHREHALQPQTVGVQFGEAIVQVPVENYQHYAATKRLGSICLLFVLGGAVYSLISAPSNVLNVESADDLLSRIATFAFVQLAAWGGATLAVWYGGKFPLRSWGLLSSVLFGCIFLGYFWTTALRTTAVSQALLGIAIIPTVGWILYASFVLRQCRTLPQFRTLFVPASQKSGIQKWWLPVVVICLSVFVWLSSSKKQAALSAKDSHKAVEFVAQRFHKPVISVQSIGNGKAVVEVKPDDDNRDGVVHLAKDTRGLWRLDPGYHATEIQIGKGDTLGPANDEWGGLIVGSVDSGTYAAIIGMGPRITGEGPLPLPAGRHKLPVGRYGIQIFDTQAGWLGDVKSSPNGEYEKIYKTVDHMFKDVQIDEGVYDVESGTYCFGIYSAEPGQLNIKPGEFSAVDVSRNVHQIARGNWVFNRNAAERFMPGQFYRFLWNGTKYSCSPDQAKVIDVLLHAYADGKSGVSEAELISGLFSDEAKHPEKLDAVFNDGLHPAWGQVISHVTADGLSLFAMTPLQDREAGLPASEATDQSGTAGRQ